MAGYRVHKKVPLRPAVQWFSTMLLITICSHTKPSTCSSSSIQYRMARYTWNTTFQQMDQGLLFHVRVNESAPVTLQPGSLGYYMGNSSALGFDLTDKGWFVIPKWFDPWKMSHDDDRIDLHNASFNIVFTLSIVSTTSKPLLFDILPRLDPSPSDAGGFHPASFEPVKIEQLDSTTFQSGRTIRVTTSFSQPQDVEGDLNNTNNNDNNSPTRYSVRIDYDHVVHNLSAYLAHDSGTHQVPDGDDRTHLEAGDTLTPDGLLFAISSTMGQLLQLDSWNFTIEVPVAEQQSKGPNTITIVSSVLGSAAATATIAAFVYFYLNSKYRRWKKDLDKLSKTMHSLPGVPMRVDFADIKKATNNFHETMRLGQGGFGAVYRCRLPAPKKGDLMEVAVKKFTRANNQGYEDFLAEVSIINRLRHKNIAPLVGWSYNRGEPILIYEYMPKGSLDQHLFHRSSNNELQEQASCIRQWGTRYNIVKDTATGLQYVHHEYEPMVLHRDIKASNILIDFTFQARLGDFGLACVLADGKNSYTDQGAPGTIGFRAPEYIYSGKATRKTDVFAFGVLVLEIVTGKRAVGRDVQFGHITDWVWKLHGEGNLLAAVDAVLTADDEFNAQEAVRLLQLGMACSSPNPSDRPSMVDAVQIISKSVPPPDMPLSKPPLVWPPEGWESSLTSDCGTSSSNINTTSTLMVETASREHVSSGRFTGYPRGRSSQEHASGIFYTAHATASN